MVDCPNCGTPVHFEVFSKAAPQSHVVFRFKPGKNEMFTAAQLGRSIAAAGDLLKSVGRAQKISTEVLVERIETAECGEISVHLLIARWNDHPQSAASRKRRQRAAGTGHDSNG